LRPPEVAFASHNPARPDHNRARADRPEALRPQGLHCCNGSRAQVDFVRLFKVSFREWHPGIGRSAEAHFVPASNQGAFVLVNGDWDMPITARLPFLSLA
jgi:hypothetical protein